MWHLKVMHRRQLAAHLLRFVATSSDSEPLAEQDNLTRLHQSELATLAQHHQVSEYLYRTRCAARRPSFNTHDEIRRSSVATAVRQLQTHRDLAFVATAFATPALQWCLMKGPVLAERVYPEPSLRPSRDLDVFVPADSFAAAIDALEANGAQLLDANWDLAIRARRGQVHVRLAHGTTMDLHWHLINSGRVRDMLNISMSSVLRNLRIVQIRDLPVSTLSVTDTVVHLGLHAALGGAWRLRWLNDLKLLIAHEVVDWASVQARADQWRARRLLGVTLMRSARLLNADVPDDVITGLLGSRLYRSTAEALDRLWPPVTAMHGTAPGRLWPQFVRDSWPDALRAAAWRVRRRASNGLRGFWHGREHPEMMSPSGGDRERERYLRLVERGELDGARSSGLGRAVATEPATAESPGR
jgi:hypothetical protein